MFTSLLLSTILAFDLSSCAVKADPISAEDNVPLILPSCPRADFPSVLASLTFLIPFYIILSFFYGIGQLFFASLSGLFGGRPGLSPY
tara:strand:- start:498 stop:761 length:264 start_codon:yes stop_codon:yes gene_type:complete